MEKDQTNLNREQEKQKTREQISEEDLEIVTGGWRALRVNKGPDGKTVSQ